MEPIYQSGKPGMLDLGYLKEIAPGDDPFIETVLKSFQEDAKQFISKLESELGNEELIVLQKSAHAMKPAGVYLGVHSLTFLVTRLEIAARNLDRREVSTLIPKVLNLTQSMLNEVDEYLLKKEMSNQ
jgi:HPt (histidine-containing phosphotransfer) domain-containing protein